jgi:acetaldehyde dehydrogenase (acetylating)
MALAGTKAAEELARLAVDETGYGVYEHKIHKNRYNTGFVARWMLERRAVGVLWVDDDARVTAVGTPMGVIAGIIPVTNPTSTALFKSLAAVKSGNAVVHAPHPRAARCTLRTAEVMAEAAVAAGAPEGVDLVPREPHAARHPRADGPPRDRAGARDRRPGMVRAAYSSGKPTIAVGAGNVPAYVGASVPDAAEAAEMIITSKAFDNGTAVRAPSSRSWSTRRWRRRSCGSSRPAGAYWMNAPAAGRAGPRAVRRPRRPAARRGRAERGAARRAGRASPCRRPRGCWPACWTGSAPTPRSPGRSSARCCRCTASATPPRGSRGAGRSSPSAGEGHTTAVHAADPTEIASFGTLRASRIVINTPALFGGMGYSTEVDPSFQLGTGTWSGSICSDNVTPLHLINIKRIAHEVRPWRTVYDPVEL